MKITKLQGMEPVVYLVRHWGRWFYVDQSGYWNPVKDVIVKLKDIKEK